MNAYRSMGSLSVYPNPRPDALMAVLKAYFDDSKSSGLLTIGGYLSDVDSWGRFESAWQQILDDFKAPYLHMKEFWDRDGIYKHIKDVPVDEVTFFRRLVAVIKEHTKFCTQTTVILEDLDKFNLYHNLTLDAHSLAIYGCLLALQTTFPNGEMEVIFDKFEQACLRIATAENYLGSDVLAPLSRKQPFLSVYSLKKEDSWRTVLPLQAGDWIAWEMRKTCVDTLPWIKKKGHDLNKDWVDDFHNWSQQFAQENDRQFRNRKSFIALRESNPPRGFIWNYQQLGVLKDSHPYGWQLKKNGGLTVFSEGQGA
jgi:hypothetical protein